MSTFVLLALSLSLGAPPGSCREFHLSNAAKSWEVASDGLDVVVFGPGACERLELDESGRPQSIRRIPLGGWPLAIHRGWLYHGNYKRTIDIFDWTCEDAGLPVEAGRIELETAKSVVAAEALDIVNETLFVGTGTVYESEKKYIGRSLRSYSIANPVAPVPLDTLALASTPLDLVFSGDLCIVPIYAGAVSIIDISHPDSMVELSNIEIGVEPKGAAVASGALIVAAEDDSMRLYDIGDPRLPRLLGTEYRPTHAIETIDGGFCTVDSALTTWSIEPGRPPEPAGFVDLGIDMFSWRYSYDGVRDARYIPDAGAVVIAAFESGTIIADVRDIENPRVIWREPIVPFLIATGAQIDGDRAYVSSTPSVSEWAYGGVSVFEIPQEGQPRLLGWSDTRRSTTQCAIAVKDRGVAYTLDCGGHRMIHIWDVSDPTTVAYIDSIDSAPIAEHHLMVSGDRLYSAGAGVALHDISVPHQPELLGHLQLPDMIGRFAGLTTVEGRDYVWIADFGVAIVDATNPDSLALTHDGPIGEYGSFRGAASEGNRLYLVSGETFIAVDISVPGDPKILAEHAILGPEPGQRYTMDVVEGRAYLVTNWGSGTGSGHLYVLDLTPKGDVTRIQSWGPIERIETIRKVPGRIFVAGSLGGGWMPLDNTDLLLGVIE